MLEKFDQNFYFACWLQVEPRVIFVRRIHVFSFDSHTLEKVVDGKSLGQHRKVDWVITFCVIT